MDAVSEVAKGPYQRWPAGVSGNPGGRPLGARGAFSEEFMRSLRKVWALEGETAMLRTAKENPTAFTALCARLLPTEVSATIEQTTPRGLDADDLAILRAIKQSLPDANSRTPSEVLNFVLDACRAHSSHQLIDATSEAQTEGPNG
jgi:hypothetical protein